MSPELDEMVHQWQYAPLNEASDPYLFVDVMYTKVREEHRVVSIREKMKIIFRITSIEEARRLKDQVLEEYADQARYKKACETLDAGFEEELQYAVVGPLIQGFVARIWWND